MDGKIVLGLLLALAGGEAVRSSTATPERRDTYSVREPRPEASKQPEDRRQNGVVLRTFPLLDTNGARRAVQYAPHPFSAGGAALFVKTSSEPGAAYTVPGIPYATAEPFLRFAYATPVVAVEGGVADKQRPAAAFVFVPGPPPVRPEPQSEARIVSLTVQNAQGEVLQPGPPVLIQEDAREDGTAEPSSTAPSSSTPAPGPPLRSSPSPPGSLVEVTESSTPQEVSRPPLIPTRPPEPPAGEDVTDGGVKDNPLHQRRKDPTPTPFFFNAQPIPLFAGLGHVGAGPTPIFLIGHHQPGQHSGALFIPPSPAPPRLFPQRQPPVHYATAPGYTSSVFTTFSSPFVSYSY